MQIIKPAAVPNHTWNLMSLLERLKTFQEIQAAYLAHKLLVRYGIIFGSQGLFEEGQQNRNNDGGLKSFTEHDEEH